MERAAKEHLYEIDLMRAFIILGVVCVHVLSFFNLWTAPLSSGNVLFDIALVALHFTRESFMFITGLVLFITYYNKPFTARGFWGKRFKLIFIPYAVWSMVYILFSGTYLPHWSWSLGNIFSTYVFAILTGSQFYLYYLVISMQLYLLFPIFMALMKRFKNYHGWIFAVSFAVQIGLMWLNKDVLQNMNTSHFPAWLLFLFQFRDRYLLTYQFWFISGALFAIHYQTIKAYLRERAKLIFWVLMAGLVTLWIHYAFDRFYLAQDETMSVLVLQPIMIPYSLVLTVGLWSGGVVWAKARLKRGVRWLSSFVKTAAAASFGVFLVHPLILHFMEVAIYRLHPTTPVRNALIPVAIAVVYGISIIIARALGRMPYVSYIVGQKTERSEFKMRVSHSS